MTQFNYSLAIIRGKHANQYELQNYDRLTKDLSLEVFTSKYPVEKPKYLPSTYLPSLADLPQNLNLIKFIANRTIGDMHILYGLEKELIPYDILHTADPYYYFSFQAAQVRRQNPRKLLVSTVWETIPFNNEKTRSKRAIKKFTQQQIDVFITYSHKAQIALIKEGVPSEKIEHLQLGIDTSRFVPAKNKQKEILFVGRLVPEKNPLLLLEAFQIFHRINPNYILRFVGSGQLENQLKKRTKLYNLTSSVLFNSALYEDMPNYYQSAEVFVLPSQKNATWEEQYGMVLLEAMSCGLPIIGTDCGAIPEILKNTGIIVPQNSLLSLVKALGELTSSKTLRRKLGTIARERATKSFNSDDFAKKILVIYEKSFRNHLS